MLYHLTPAYFIKNRNSEANDASKDRDNVKPDNHNDSDNNIQTQTKDSSPLPYSASGRTSPPHLSSSPGPSTLPYWRSISVSTRWRWDDILHTENDVDEEGNNEENVSADLVLSNLSTPYDAIHCIPCIAV